MILSSLAIAIALASSPVITDIQTPSSDALMTPAVSEHLSSQDLAMVRVRYDTVPDYCEVYYMQNPITGERECNAVVCRPPHGAWSIHECSEFRL